MLNAVLPNQVVQAPWSLRSRSELGNTFGIAVNFDLYVSGGRFRLACFCLSAAEFPVNLKRPHDINSTIEEEDAIAMDHDFMIHGWGVARFSSTVW